MTRLTGNESWNWGTAQQEAFDELKARLAQDVVLALPTEARKFRVEADASESAIGTVLSQEQERDWSPPVAATFMYQTLSIDRTCDGSRLSIDCPPTIKHFSHCH